MFELTPFFAEMEPAAAGQSTGKIIVMLAALAGAVKCYEISRRPTANAKCVWSLLLLLLVWFFSGMVGLLRESLPQLTSLVVVFSFLCLVIAVAALVLAIIGLIEYSQRRHHYTQGRAQAIWSLALCGLFLSVAAVGFLGGRSRAIMTRTQPADSQTQSFPELNFKFDSPGRPWVKLDAAKVNPDAKVGYMRSNPNVFFMIIAEELGVTEFDNDGLVEVVTAKLKSVTDSAHIVRKEASRVGPLHGTLLESEVKLRRQKIAYAHWICVTNGWAYQLVGWGPQKERAAVFTESQRLTGQFALLNYERQASAGGTAPVTDFVSTNFQFRVRWSGSDWRPWPDLAKDSASASFGALNVNDAALTVSAVSFPGMQPHPEAIYYGFVHALGLDLESEKPSSRIEVLHGQFSGIQTELRQLIKNQDEFTYRLKILHSGHLAYCVAAWVHSKDPRGGKILTDALARVELPERPPLLDPRNHLTEAEKRSHRFFLNEAGMFYFKARQYEPGARFFKAAFDLAGDVADTPYLANYVQASIRTGKLREALELLDNNPRQLEGHDDLKADRAFLQAETGQTERALTNYARLFSAGYRDEAHFREYAALLAQSAGPEKALAEVEQFIQIRDTIEIRLLQAGLLKRQKKWDEAVALLELQRKKNPFNMGLAGALIDTLIQAQRHNEALALSQELTQGHDEDASIWYLKGRAEYGLKWYRLAKESFERAAKKAPNDSEIRSFLDHVSGLLGEGANSTLKEIIPPVAVPATLLTPLPPAPASESRDYGAYYTRRLTAISFTKGKELKTSDYVTVKTLNSAGVSAFSTFQISFNPLNEEIYINRLEVRAPDGSLVSTGRVSDFFILDEQAGSSASHRKILNMPLSGLLPGHSVELVATRREFGPPETFAFLTHNFSRPFPVHEGVLFVSGDTGAIRYASSANLAPERLPEGLLWKIKNPTVFRWEPMQATPVDYLPTVWLSDIGTRWADVVTNYLGSIRDHLELPMAQRDLARQLTANATNDAQKIDAIAGHLQTNYTYKAIEFGRRARIPQKTPDIVRNKYGDCKDHALLAQQMLAAAGVPASLALVSFNAPLRQDLPSLDQFDHMIVHIAGPDGGRFLDCTDKAGNVTATIPLGLAGREALILDWGNPRFKRIPDYPPDASTIRSVRTAQLTNQTDVLVNETVTMEGAHAAWLRDYLRNQPVTARQSYLANLLKNNTADLLTLRLENLELPKTPLIINLGYTLRAPFQDFGKNLTGKLPACFEQSYLAVESVDKRFSPFQVGVPLTIESTVTISAPEGFRASLTDAPTQKIEHRFVRCQLDTTAGKTGWRLNYKVYEPAGRFPAADYADFRAAMERTLNALSPKVTFERINP